MISGDAEIYGNAKVYSDAIIRGQAQVGGDAVICGRSILEGDVNTPGGRIENVHWWRDIP